MPISQRSSDQPEPLSSAVTVGIQSSSAQPHMAVFSADPQGGFSACNAAFLKLLGYSVPELLGRDFFALFIPPEKPAASVIGDNGHSLRQEIRSAASTPAGYQGQLLVRPKTGANFLVQFSATMLTSTPAALIAIVVPMGEFKPGAAPDSPVVPGVVSRKIDGTQFILASPVMHKFMTLVDR